MASIQPFCGISDYSKNGLIYNIDAGLYSSYSGSGTTWSDISGNANNATLTAAPTYSQTSAAGYGSFAFNGSTQYVTSAGLTIPTNFTHEVWLKSQNGVVISENGASGYHLSNMEVVAGVMKVGYWNGSVASSINLSTLTAGNWYHVVMTFTSPSSLVGYINGAQSNTGTITKSNPTSGLFYYYAHSDTTNFGSGAYFSGSIAKAAFYNRALTASEVSQNFNYGRGRFGI